jgi:hypothetical protein
VDTVARTKLALPIEGGPGHRALSAFNKGYRAYHCVRPAPARGRPSGGITVFLRETSPLFTLPGLRVVGDPSLGVLWVEVPALTLTIAVCYFSPAGSMVYSSGLVRPDPISGLLDGLRAAEAKSHQHVVLGDLNIRIGRLSCDVPAHVAVPPALSDPSTLPALHALLNTPHHRASRDTTRSGRQQAEGLLNGLQSVSSVVLNGRAPGDEGGGPHTAYTYWTGKGAAHRVGNSVVDLGCVSATLYQRVRQF